MARLSVKKGKLSGLLLEIDKPLIVLGRDPECDYFFEDTRLSRRHCTIHKNCDEYYVLDNGSSNHVYVNGVQVSEAVLHDKDRITIGHTELEFELDAEEKKAKTLAQEMVENSTWGKRHTVIDAQDDSYIKLPSRVTKKHLKEVYKRMVRVSKIASLLQSSTSWYELFKRVADILVDEFKSDAVFIFRVLANGEFAAFVKKEKKQSRAKTKKVSRKILQDCYRHKVGYIVSDAKKDEHYADDETVIRRSVRSAMCVPVILDNKVEAIIYLDSLSAKNIFSHLDLQVLTGIAAQLTSHMRSILLVQCDISRRVMHSELEVARKIQTMFLSDKPPEIEGVSLASYSEPAKTVGGDYFDFVSLSENKVGIIIADVSGKGLPSALMMASFRAHFLTEMHHTREPKRIMQNMNKYVWEDVKGRLYVTAALIIYDTISGELEYVNAGHSYPLVLCGDGSVKEYKTGGFYLGLQEKNTYEKGHDKLETGDTLVLFTDGFTDQISEQKGIFGRKRLLQELQASIDQEPERIVDSLVNSIHDYLGKKEIFDDMSIIVFRRNKKSGKEK